MKYKVIQKQKNSKMCLTCGLKNDFGLKASFYELENGEIVAIFKPKVEHQGYPNILHGGMSGAILDETIGRAILIGKENVWGVTVELNLKYHKPVPLNEELRVVGRITRETKRIFEGTGEILLENGDVAVSGQGKYIKMKLEEITEFSEANEEWRIASDGEEIIEIEI